ncbi:aminotransferase class V-fold PLP-dependent enzyme, partial [Streptococcus ruminantium]
MLEHCRADFPILDQMINDEPLVYLDNAATTQKPQQVLSVLADYYHNDNANVHRGVHTLSERATARYEAARQTVADFINA